MSKWYQAAELSGLPGLPSTPQGVIYKAKKEHWFARYRQGQGGGKEYHEASLPVETRAALHFKHSAQLPATKNDNELVIKEQVDQKLTSLKGWQREIFDARVSLYREFERLQDQYGTNQAVDVMVDMAKRDALPEHLKQCVAQANARKGEERTLSRSLILGWQRKVRRYGIAALAPAAVEKMTVPEWALYFMQFYQLPTNPTIPEAMEEMAKILPEGMSMPSYNQVLRFHNKRSHLDREKGRKTGSAYKARKGYRKRDTSGLFPLQGGVCDGHTFKARVSHPTTGSPFKPEVCTVIDLATKVAVGWSMGLAESADTVATAIRHAATVNETKPYGGIFNVLYTDGGAGNMAKVNHDEIVGLFSRIGTEHTKGIAGNAQARGAIERLNATLWIRASRKLLTCTAKSMDQLTARNIYIVMNKELKETGKSDKLLSWPQFRDFAQGEVDSYNRRPHSELPKLRDPETGRIRHMSPLECWAWHMANGWQQEDYQISEQEIETMWLPRVERKVIRSMVQLGKGTFYYNKDLEHIEGDQVQVAYYMHDPARVQIWDSDERLVCYAQLDANKSDYFPKSMMERAADNRAKRRAKIKLMQLDEIENERRGVIETTTVNGELIQFPGTPSPIKVDREKLAAEMNKPKEFEIPHNERDMYRLWQDLDRRLRSGETMEDRAMRFYESFQMSATYRTFTEVEEHLSLQQG